MPGHGERQHALPLGAAVLDARTATTRRRSAVSSSRNRRAAAAPAGVGQHALVLREAARAVHPVPLQDRVERIEERLGVHDARARAGAGACAVDDAVERAHRQPVERRSSGSTNGTREAPLGRRRTLAGASSGSAQRPRMRMPRPMLRAARQAVDPAHGHRPVAGGCLEPVDERVDVGDALALLPDPGRARRAPS